MPTLRKPIHRRSDPGLDIHRGLAVVLMFLAHAWRVTGPTLTTSAGLTAWIDRTLAWMDRGVAYVAASFLFIAGFSLVLARRDTTARPGPWLVGVLRRAGWLYLLSVSMFLPEHGVQWPDMIASSGILAMIAAAITVTGFAMQAPMSNLVLGALSAVVLAASWGLEHAGLSVSGLNAGPGGTIPLLVFSPLGALAARLTLRKGAKFLLVAASLAFPVFLFAMIHDGRWLAFYTSKYHDHGGLAIADWLGMTHAAAGTIDKVFWNPSILGTFGLLSPVAATTGVLLVFQENLARQIVMRPLLLLGRHALFVFLAHYALLGLVVLAGLRPLHAGSTLWVFGFVTAACVGMSAALEWRGRPSRSQSTAAPPR